MTILRSFCPDIEIYSIDEAFLILDGFSHKNLEAFTLNIRQKIKQWTGIPVSIGFSHSKTLAKIANNIAKKEKTSGVFDLTNIKLQDEILQRFPVENIWGIGSRLSQRLQDFGINTAKELKEADPKLLRKNFSVVMEKIIAELNRISCIPLEEFQPKKQIMCSRSFGKLIPQFDELAESISYHTANACVKLRRQKSLAQGIYVFTHTNRFRLADPQYGNQISYYFEEATADTGYIIGIAKKCLRSIYKKGYKYHKAGVMLLDLLPDDVKQLSLLSNNDNTRKNNLMNTVDEINQKLGKKTIFYGAEGINQNWHIKREHRSLRYTTRIEELLTAYC